jgi:hypothetical protein
MIKMKMPLIQIIHLPNLVNVRMFNITEVDVDGHRAEENGVSTLFVNVDATGFKEIVSPLKKPLACAVYTNGTTVNIAPSVFKIVDDTVLDLLVNNFPK